MKKRTVHSISEVEELEKSLQETIEVSCQKLGHLITIHEPVSLFSQIKFQKIGVDPLDKNRSLNFIEQLNQSFTYLATIYAVKYLFEKYPEYGPFTLNLGTAKGFDIEGKNQRLVAEVFATTSTKNNKKLSTEKKKLEKVVADHRYIFFISPGHKNGVNPKLSSELVTIFSFGVE